MGKQDIRIADIRTDGGTQPRAELHWLVITDYAEDMRRGVEFPPVVVFYDGTDYWLADGFHRLHAAKEAGLATIAADVRQGTRRDAVLYSVGANASHGLRRTNSDKQRAVKTLLDDAEWVKLSDREIARLCAVQHPMVGRIREELTGTKYQSGPQPRKGADGRTINTANIGTAPKPPMLPPAWWPMLTIGPDKPLSQPVMDALTDATFHAPDHAADLVAKSANEGLAPDAINHAREVLSDPETPPALADYILAPETMVQDAQGHIAFSEVQRVQTREMERTPDFQGMPVAKYLVQLGGYTGIKPRHIEAWLDTTGTDDWEVARITLDGVREFMELIEGRINGRQFKRLRVVEG